MGRKSRSGNVSHKTHAESSENGPRKAALAILTRHTLLTEDWKEDVQEIQGAIGRFKADRPFQNDCQVVFFEMAHDRHLHVNVMHKYPTKEVTGWAGPGSVAYGVVHNRTFADTPPHLIIRHIRDMVFAPNL